MKLFLVALMGLFLSIGCVKKPSIKIDGNESVYPDFIEKNSKIVEIYASSRLFEAPVWDRVNKKLYFTGYEKGKEMLMCFVRTGLAEDVPLSQGSGGTFIGENSNFLYTANGESHEIIRFELYQDQWKHPKVLAYDKSWFQPNDLCVTKDGKIYFTDPDFKNKKDGAVYYLSKEGQVTKLPLNLPVPNGIISSNDGKKLYISDSYLKEWREYQINRDGTLSNGKVFFKPNVLNKNNPDGMTIDEKGNLYFTGMGGIWIVSPDGQAIGFIAIPEFCTNVAFGGKEYKSLYITCYKKVYQLDTKIKGFIP